LRHFHFSHLCPFRLVMNLDVPVSDRSRIPVVFDECIRASSANKQSMRGWRDACDGCGFIPARIRLSLVRTSSLSVPEIP
jgi:hypothetical protein